ncbi:MAG: hypothetical protein E6J66_07005 [Deltaproteobacteria bacterium]|nr:MAG: hypothetical protein E6J66_07005 [Deltaproteobacteria bacterium]
MLVLVAGALLDRGRPAFDAVRPQAVSATVRFLSDDLLEGRGTGTRGHAIAEQYVATRMQALGVRPAGEMARAELLVGISLLSGPRPRWKPESPFR